MKLRLYQQRYDPKDPSNREDDPRHHRLTDSDPANIPANVIAGSQDSATRDLRQQAVLQMQHRHGNSVVRRYLADLGVLPTRSVQRKDEVADNWRESGTGPKADDTHIARPNIMLISVTGEKQGVFKGNSAISGHAGQIEGTQFSYQQTTTGIEKPTSRTEITFTKEFDQSTPQFLQALVNDEKIKAAKFEVGDVTDKGEFKARFVLDVKGGEIIQVVSSAPDKLQQSSHTVPDAKEFTKIRMIFGKTSGFSPVKP